MSTSPLPPPLPRKQFSLARLATIFAVVCIVTFGLCTVSANLPSRLVQKGDLMGYIIGGSAVIEVICLASLLIVGCVALGRSVLSKE